VNLREADAGVGSIPPEAPANWWVCYFFEGSARRAGPYHRPVAEHNLRVTHWRPGAKPQLKQLAVSGKKAWSDEIATRKRKKRLTAANNGRLAKRRKR
jgi:hypothetical protein